MVPAKLVVRLWSLSSGELGILRGCCCEAGLEGTPPRPSDLKSGCLLGVWFGLSVLLYSDGCGEDGDVMYGESFSLIIEDDECVGSIG